MYYPASIIVRCKACGKEHTINLIVDRAYNYRLVLKDDHSAVVHFTTALRTAGYLFADDPEEQKRCLICPNCQNEVQKIEKEAEEEKQKFIAARTRSLFENGR